MHSQHVVVGSSELGRIAVSTQAIVQIVGYAAAESYGVVALAGRGLRSRLVSWGIEKGVDVECEDGGRAIELRVVGEHRLRLSELADAVRARVLYEHERMVGIPIASPDVRIAGLRSR